MSRSSETLSHKRLDHFARRTSAEESIVLKSDVTALPYELILFVSLSLKAH